MPPKHRKRALYFESIKILKNDRKIWPKSQKKSKANKSFKKNQKQGKNQKQEKNQIFTLVTKYFTLIFPGASFCLRPPLSFKIFFAIVDNLGTTMR